MEQTFKIKSSSPRGMIKQLADKLEVPYLKQQGFALQLPAKLGKGEITAIKLSHGLSLNSFKCTFKHDVRFNFVPEKVHPLKFLYVSRGIMSQAFSDDTNSEKMVRHQTTIVANEKGVGHSLNIQKGKPCELLIIAIDREEFLPHYLPQVNKLTLELKTVLNDVNANKRFHHSGFYGLEFEKLLIKNLRFKDNAFANKLYLEYQTKLILADQCVRYERALSFQNKQSGFSSYEYKRLNEVMKYIEDHLSSELSIAHLSKLSGLNPNKLQKGFKRLHNMTVNEYTTAKKLQHALALFNDPEMTVSDVAFSVGFESKSYFSKIFKKTYCMCPRDYRKLNYMES